MKSLFVYTFVTAGLSLLYIWALYPILVTALSKFRNQTNEPYNNEYRPTLSVLIACLNEEESIGKRIDDIYQCNYPDELIQIVLISDGSTDNTVKNALAKNTPNHTITIVENAQKSGRAIAHNTGVLQATGEILVFTDAGTAFDKEFLHAIVKPFSSTNVGFVTGALRYTNADRTDVTQSAGLYWKFEQILRQSESDLGINVFGSGACCAMRKTLYRDIPPTGDVDFNSPLDAALQDHLCIHQPSAIAYDEMPDSRENELKARIRMTSKNFKGTLERWGWSGLKKYPLKSIVILSHKYGRWITPFLLIALFLSSLASWAMTGGVLTTALVLAQIAFYTMGAIGFFKISAPGASTIYSFLLGNYGIMLGVIRAISGRVVATYSPIRN